jgi:hypothetical protein
MTNVNGESASPPSTLGVVPRVICVLQEAEKNFIQDFLPEPLRPEIENGSTLI